MDLYWKKWQSSGTKILMTGPTAQKSARQRKTMTGPTAQKSARQRKTMTGPTAQKSARQRKTITGPTAQKSVRQRKTMTGPTAQKSARQRKTMTGPTAQKSARQRKTMKIISRFLFRVFMVLMSASQEKDHNWTYPSNGVQACCKGHLNYISQNHRLERQVAAKVSFSSDTVCGPSHSQIKTTPPPPPPPPPSCFAVVSLSTEHGNVVGNRTHTDCRDLSNHTHTITDSC